MKNRYPGPLETGKLWKFQWNFIAHSNQKHIIFKIRGKPLKKFFHFNSLSLSIVQLIDTKSISLLLFFFIILKISSIRIQNLKIKIYANLSPPQFMEILNKMKKSIGKWKFHKFFRHAYSLVT